MIIMLKKWYNVELNKKRAEMFSKYLKEQNIKFEPSEAYNLIHFECYMTFEELKAANQFLDGIMVIN
jgi:hypothetical protein